MKMIKMRCSNCGAEMEMDPERKEVFCSYCGTKFVIDDESVHITNRIVDEARLKEAEIRLKELEYAHEKELKEERLLQEQKKTFRISLAVCVCAVLLTFSLEDMRPFSVLILIIAAVILSSMRKRDREGIRSVGDGPGCSPKSRLAALLLCVFLGEFGVHYFYVGRIGMGILYLCTFGLFGIGWLVDIIRLICGTFRDSAGLYLDL